MLSESTALSSSLSEILKVYSDISIFVFGFPYIPRSVIDKEDDGSIRRCLTSRRLSGGVRFRLVLRNEDSLDSNIRRFISLLLWWSRARVSYMKLEPHFIRINLRVSKEAHRLIPRVVVWSDDNPRNKLSFTVPSIIQDPYDKGRRFSKLLESLNLSLDDKVCNFHIQRAFSSAIRLHGIRMKYIESQCRDIDFDSDIAVAFLMVKNCNLTKVVDRNSLSALLMYFVRIFWGSNKVIELPGGDPSGSFRVSFKGDKCRVTSRNDLWSLKLETKNIPDTASMLSVLCGDAYGVKDFIRLGMA